MRLPILLAVLAAIGLAGAVLKARADVAGRPAAEALETPAGSPFPGGGVAGAGMVEPLDRTVAIAPPFPALVLAVRVQVGDRVGPGDELLRLDSRSQVTARAQRAAELGRAEAELARLRALPRAESLPALEARLAEAEARLRDAGVQERRAAELAAAQAGPAEDAERARLAVAAAEARRAAAAADLAEARAGAWDADLAVAQAAADAARAALVAAETEVERTVVRAPRAATVLAVDARPGEWAQPGGPALATLGDLSELRVRADIDEADVPRLDLAAPAVAVVRGGRARIPLALIRREPLMTPKRSLTGDAIERVDVRVAQVLYRCDPAAAAAAGLVPGQLVDVYIGR